MQINHVKDSTEILGIGAVAAEKGLKDSIPVKESIGLGEAFNKNMRTGIAGMGDTSVRMKENDREFAEFKEKAERYTEVLNDNVKKLTGEMVAALEKEGVSAENSDADLVKKSIENIVEKREFSREQLARQVEKSVQREEAAVKIALGSAGDERLVKQLEASGVPVTKENLARLSKAVAFAEETVKNISEPAIVRMIDGDIPETVSGIYMAEHSEARAVFPQEAMKDWNAVAAQAESLLVNQGITPDNESISAAKWLFEKDMEITAPNIAKFLSLNELKADAGSEKGMAGITKNVAEAISEGKDPLHSIIGTANKRQAAYTLNYFSVTAETRISIQDISARRALEEIRLRLTGESVVKMLNKGIKIDLSDLSGLVENLKREEDGYYKALLDGAEGLEEYRTSANKSEVGQIELLRSVVSVRTYAMTRIEGSDYKNGAISAAYVSETRITLAAYHEAGLAYERGATEIRADLGDSIKKAFVNIDEVLAEHDLALTDANRKAVRMLSYNRAEVNYESVTAMKEAGLLTETTLRALKPATVAAMIKSGLNPLDMPMTELLEAANRINEKVFGEDENYSRYLYKLEQGGEVTAEEREAYIGIYRLIRQIERGDGAAVGSVSLAEQALTLRNMLSAVRTGKLGGFDERADAAFGELIEVMGGGNKIDVQIDAAYRKLLSGNIRDMISETDNSYFERKEAQLTEAISTDEVEKLLDGRAGITLSNAFMQGEVSKGRKSLLNLINSMSEDEKEEINELSVKMLDEFNEERFSVENEKAITDALSRKASKILESEEIVYKTANEIIKVNKLISLSAKRAESESYDIPFIYDKDKLADLSLTIRGGSREADRGKVGILLTKEDEEIGSEFRIVSGRITGYFKTYSRETLEEIRTDEQELRAALTELGLQVGEISYHLGNATSQIRNSDDIYNGNIKTSDIYKAAKKIAGYVLKVTGVRG